MEIVRCSICGVEILPNHARLFAHNGQNVCMGCEGAIKESVVVFELSPELTNGQNIVIEEAVSGVLSAVEAFCQLALAGEYEPGESFKVTIRNMTRSEIWKLPDI